MSLEFICLLMLLSLLLLMLFLLLLLFAFGCAATERRRLDGWQVSGCVCFLPQTNGPGPEVELSIAAAICQLSQ